MSRIDGFGTTLRMQGCSGGADCKYITLVASYSDVAQSRRQTWVQQMNDEFDLLRVGRNEKGQLYMFGAYVIEGPAAAASSSVFSTIGRPTPRRSGTEAINGGYTKKK
jgi:hypothetical protein